MNEFIKEFGKENIIIMLVIVAVVILALILIIIIEKMNTKKTIRKELKNIEDSLNEKKGKELVREIQKHEAKEQVVVNHPKPEVIIKPVPPKMIEPEEELENTKEFNFKKSEPEEELELLEDIPEEEEVYYAPLEPSVEEAKEKLEEVTKRLIDDEPNLVDHTHFEMEQEEKSIISYEELVKASHDIDEKNDRVLRDEDEAAITIEELYKKHQQEQSIIDGIDAVNEKAKVSNPVFEEEPKKFKNSEVISPVFGIYSGKVKQKDVLKEIDKDIKPKDLEDEIQRTEDFLTELKKLKNKLD